jgi:hypothetical protein
MQYVACKVTGGDKVHQAALQRMQQHVQRTSAALVPLSKAWRSPGVLPPCGEVVAWPLHLLPLHALLPEAPAWEPPVQAPPVQALLLVLLQGHVEVQGLLAAAVAYGAAAALVAAALLPALMLLAWLCSAWPGGPQAWWVAAPSWWAAWVCHHHWRSHLRGSTSMLLELTCTMRRYSSGTW